MNTEYYRSKDKDEYYTPSILVEPILQFIKPNSIVWCPFDKFESEFVQQIIKQGHKVIYGHIEDGYDFFEYEPTYYDCVVSNPPFTRKLEVLDRLYKLGKPFAMILGLPILNYQEVGQFFLDKDLQLLIVDKKVSFDGNTSSFNNSYFCSKFLPRDLMFHHLEHNNSNKNYKPSSLYARYKIN